MMKVVLVGGEGVLVVEGLRSDGRSEVNLSVPVRRKQNCCRMCDGESRAGHQSFGSLEAAANRSDTIGMPQTPAATTP